ncbi:MAG: hypothetical protein JO189_25390 [Deltaproteobacteria bacterium]|nr:hypothetical protein [Deltaproteobacteria bacterium]
MAPFWSGVAIGLGLSLAIFLVLAAIFLVLYIGEWLIVLVAALYIAARDGLRAERARIDRERAQLGLPPFNRRREAMLNLRRAWRMARHPIRERALIAESFRALKNPATHKWSDGLS